MESGRTCSSVVKSICFFCLIGTGTIWPAKFLAVGLGRELVAAGVGVAVLPGDAVPLGDVLRGDAHVVVVERVPQAVVDHVINDLGVRHSHAVAVAALGQQEGRWSMFSIPPASTTSASPRISWAALTIACSPGRTSS